EPRQERTRVSQSVISGGMLGSWEGTTLTISATTARNPVYSPDDADVLISKSSWPLKLSGVVFAGLLVIGRSASYGNITWTPTFHQANTPLTVLVNSAPKPAPAPSLPKTSPSDPAALSKKSAASEIIQFSPGK